MTTHQIDLATVPAVRRGTPAVVSARPFAKADRAEPWRRGHVLASVVLAGIGAIGMAVCWYGGAGELTYHDQLPWLVGSIVSTGVVVLGGVVWLVCAFREVAVLQHHVLAVLAPWLADWRVGEAGPETAAPGVALVTAPRMNRAHRPGCLMVRGKAGLEPVTAAEVAARGLIGCGACQT